MIDPVAVKAAVKAGQLEVFIERENILLRDTTTGEAAKIGTVRSGKWIDGFCSRCSHDCGVVTPRRQPKWCEKCGAYMRGEEE